jgi:spore coat protein CotH
MKVSSVYTDSTREPIAYYKTEWTNPLRSGASAVKVVALNRTATFDIIFENELIDTGLPVVYIETDNHQTIDSKEVYVNANMIIRDKGKVVNEGALRIRGRGNATWISYPKKPYKLKLDEKAGLLGMEADKDWVLLANYCDKTLMRTSIAFRLSELMNFPWTPKARFVEVVLNGKYLGNYQLTEGIKQDAKRVNIPKRGYIVERDGYYQQEPIWFETQIRKYGYSFKNPDTDDITQDEISYIQNYLDEFEKVLFSDKFSDPISGFRKYMDLKSFARWYVFQQILANMDTNVYLTKDDRTDATKLFMGPVWDFEWSMGIGWYDGVRPRPANYPVWNGNAFYFDRLLQDPGFADEVKSEWKTYRSLSTEILKHIDGLKQELAESQKLNFQRWDIMDQRISVGGIPMGSFEEEVECDIQFFNNHINWLETSINKL